MRDKNSLKIFFMVSCSNQTIYEESLFEYETFFTTTTFCQHEISENSFLQHEISEKYPK